MQNLAMRSEKGKRCTLKTPWPGKELILIRNGVRSEELMGDTVSFTTTMNENVEIRHE